MKRSFILFTLLCLGLFSGCFKKGHDEIVVIIEDATFKGAAGDTSKGPSAKPPEPSEKRSVNLTGAVTLLKKDLEAADLQLMKRHTEALKRALEQELLKPAENERKRTLNLFSIKLSGLGRSLDEAKTKVALVRERPSLGRLLDELYSLARRIESRE